MLTTLGIAVGGAIILLVLSWVTSTIGFALLVKTKGMPTAILYTKAVGQATGLLIGLGILVTGIKLVVDLVGG